VLWVFGFLHIGAAVLSFWSRTISGSDASRVEHMGLRRLWRSSISTLVPMDARSASLLVSRAGSDCGDIAIHL